MMAHQLFIDLGNSRLKVWLYHAQQEVLAVSELHLQSPIDLLRGMLPQLAQYALDCVVLASVLTPEDNARLEQLLRPLCAQVVFAHVQPQLHGLSTLYDVQKLGIDRWLQLLGAPHATHAHLVVFGCGTALTIDVVQHGVHQGGFIVPNIYLQRDALLENTRKIKQVGVQFDDLSLAQTTSTAVQHGILSMVSAMVHSMMQRYPGYALFTGGDAPVIMHAYQQLLALHHVPVQPMGEDSALLLKGLRAYAQAMHGIAPMI